MSDLLVRNVPEPVVRELKARAERHGRSLQQELLRILSDAAEDLSEHYLVRAREHRARYLAEGRTFPDSSDLIREDRER